MRPAQPHRLALPWMEREEVEGEVEGEVEEVEVQEWGAAWGTLRWAAGWARSAGLLPWRT